MRRGVLLAWVSLLAAACFGAGLSTGVLIARQAAAPPDHAYADELRSELGLDDKQYEQVTKIVDEYGGKLDQMYADYLAKLRTDAGPLKAEIDKKIRPVLRPDQLEKFEGRGPSPPVGKQ